MLNPISTVYLHCFNQISMCVQPKLNHVSTRYQRYFNKKSTNFQRLLNQNINHVSTNYHRFFNQKSTNFQRLFNVDIWRWNNVEVSTLPQLSYATKIQRWFNVEEQRWFNVDSTLKCLLGRYVIRYNLPLFIMTFKSRIWRPLESIVLLFRTTSHIQFSCFVQSAADNIDS